MVPESNCLYDSAFFNVICKSWQNNFLPGGVSSLSCGKKCNLFRHPICLILEPLILRPSHDFREWWSFLRRHVPYLSYRWLLHPVSSDISLCSAVRWLRFLIKRFISMAAFIKQISAYEGKGKENRRRREHGLLSTRYWNVPLISFAPCGVSIFPLKCGLNKVAKKHMLSCQTFHLFGRLKAAWERSLPLPEEKEQSG